MGRFATSIIFISVVLCTLPMGQLRLHAMQDGDVSVVNATASENASGDASATGNATSNDASQAPSESAKTVPSGSDTPVNPASPPPPPTLTNGSGASAASNGNAAVTAPVAAGSGDGSNPPPKSNPTSSSIGPGEISVEVGTPPDGAFKKETSFSELFFANPLNLILFAFIALYVLLLFLPKPGAKERKLQQQLLSSLKKNDRVVLNSGIHGVVSNINTEAGTVTIRVDESSNAKITVDRAAIRNVVA